MSNLNKRRINDNYVESFNRSDDLERKNHKSKTSRQANSNSAQRMKKISNN